MGCISMGAPRRGGAGRPRAPTHPHAGLGHAAPSPCGVTGTRGWVPGQWRAAVPFSCQGRGGGGEAGLLRRGVPGGGARMQ